MKNITLYGGKPYDRSGKIRWLLAELGVRHENHWLNVDAGDLESTAYRKVNPLGRIPAVTLDGEPMIESGAIMAFFADQYPEKNMAPPLNSKLRTRYLQWMYFAVSVDSFASRIAIIEDIPAGETAAQKMNALLEEVSDHVKVLGDALTNHPYLIGEFSAADIGVGYHLYFASLWPELNQIFEGNAAVSSYLKRLKNRPLAKEVEVFTFE